MNTDLTLHYARSTGAMRWDLQYIEICLRAAINAHGSAPALLRSAEEVLADVRRALAEQAERDAASDVVNGIAFRTLAAPLNEAVPS